MIAFIPQLSVNEARRRRVRLCLIGLAVIVGLGLWQFPPPTAPPHFTSNTVSRAAALVTIPRLLLTVTE